MAYLPATLKRIVQTGANLEICDDVYLPDTLKEVVQLAKNTGAHVTIETSRLLPDTLHQLAIMGGKNVTIRLRSPQG